MGSRKLWCIGKSKNDSDWYGVSITLLIVGGLAGLFILFAGSSAIEHLMNPQFAALNDLKNLVTVSK